MDDLEVECGILNIVRDKLSKTYKDMRYFPDITSNQLESVDVMLKIIERTERLTGGKCPRAVEQQTE